MGVGISVHKIIINSTLLYLKLIFKELKNIEYLYTIEKLKYEY